MLCVQMRAELIIVRELLDWPDSTGQQHKAASFTDSIRQRRYNKN
jgi:hypothetical protein